MSYVIILDNGEDYSDHNHWCCLTCDTQEQAERAVSAFNAWKNSLNECIVNLPKEPDIYGNMHVPYSKKADIIRSFPAPPWFYRKWDDNIDYAVYDYTASYLKVPEWFNGGH